eukprot:TRINITY_DN62202_c0_g1_i1.p1 TRINITY_DN62202_c0_g1~~TRINITY_DN62202_c0_g1_i1.p1  ORF type:complete len:442 (+),score=70.49 TRINITY_DN62202_c0_g1_i1:70-1395(+)
MAAMAEDPKPKAAAQETTEAKESASMSSATLAAMYSKKGPRDGRSAGKPRSSCTALAMSPVSWLWSSGDAEGADGELWEPGVRRNLTETYEDLRALHRERRETLAGQRRSTLRGILEEHRSLDQARRLAQFVQSSSSTSGAEMPPGCSNCNTRLFAASPRGGFLRRGSSMPGTSPAKHCFACARWHCEPRCHRIVDLTVFLGEAEHRDRQYRHLREQDCCETCWRFLEVMRWSSLPPPACLDAVSLRVLTSYKGLAGTMTKLIADLAQFEGLVRVKQLHEDLEQRVDFSPQGEELPALPQEYQDELVSSRSRALQARTELEQCIRAIASMQVASTALSSPRGGAVASQVQAPPLRNLRVRDGLTRLAEIKMETLKPRLTAAAAHGMLSTFRPPGRGSLRSSSPTASRLSSPRSSLSSPRASGAAGASGGADCTIEMRVQAA